MGLETGMSSLELCAGAGGQALGLSQAGFVHAGVVEIDHHCCQTLRFNRPDWKVFEKDLALFLNQDASSFKGVDFLAGGLPCPPFSVAGKQLGINDERNLFPLALELVDLLRPRAVMIENVRGFLDPIFEAYRAQLQKTFAQLGYLCQWRLLNASDFGVPQLRPRVVIVAIRKKIADSFSWPRNVLRAKSVGETLGDLMGAKGWPGAGNWAEQANSIAPTIVGGSKKHGGPDLGPTRARQAWAVLGVDGLGIADEPPSADFVGTPRLTVSMVARLQGFPDHWQFAGRKTAAYRQVGNAFPPPVAESVGRQIMLSLATPSLVQVAG